MCNYPHVMLHPPAKFVIIGQTSVEFRRHIDFSRWRS